MKCHICGEETDFNCQDCDEPVCEDCCVPMTYMNQIDYALCTSCEDTRECEQRDEAIRDDEIADALKAKRDARNKASKERYWRPENVKKRREAKAERKRLHAEQTIRNLAEAFKIVGGMMR